MPERTPMEDAVKRAFDANVRYWETMGRATSDYMQAVTKLWAEAPLTWMPGTQRPQATSAGTSPAGAPPTVPAILLEARVGEEARAMLMISNDLTRHVDADVVASPLTGPSGDVRVKVRTHPSRVSLAGGAHEAVTLMVNITETLQPGVDYRAEVNVPGLAAQGVPVIVRRLPDTSG